MAARYDSVITRWWSGTFTTATSENSEALSAEEAKSNSEQVSIQIESEGAVLLKNNGLLPMERGNVALLGYVSQDPVYIGAGSVAQGDGSTAMVDFATAFAEDGFAVDETMRQYYQDYMATESRGDNLTDMQALTGADYNIYDEPISQYRDKLDAAAAANDTAIVVFGRKGGENGDLPIDMANYKNGVAGRTYLELQDTERELLDYAEQNFKHVVVLLDSTNAMQLDFLDDEKVDAAIWVGAPGASGLAAIPKIMTGEVNPSGHTVDVFPYDIRSNTSFLTCTAGTYNNYDDFDMTDAGFDNKVDGGMIWYPESIYMGYRYYETAAADGVIDYGSAVQFPFGFGLSYTTFDWKLGETSLGGVGKDISVKVEVTNTGTVAGKDVVQLYVEAPYTTGGIEKAARVLVAFAKTSLLEPGDSETVTLTMAADDLASFDYKGRGCYVAEAGEYKLHLQTDSHNDKEGISPIIYTVDADRVYNDAGVGKRSTDASVAENRFEEASAGDGNVGSSIPWMTRANLEGTHPNQTMGGVHITAMDVALGDTCVERMRTSEGGSDVSFNDDDSYECASLVPVSTSEQNGLSVQDVAGYTEWNDPIWDKLVNQMSVEDMCTLLCDCGYGTPVIDSVGKGMATDLDGPAGISSQNLNYYGHEFCGEPVTAATWNVDLAAQMGSAVGDEAIAAGANGWYAPGCDLHRTPFGGRCAEYYSEDPLLTGKIAAAEIRAVQEKGVYCYVKHFAFNESDNLRGGMYTWINEQAIREIYLRGFELAIKEGGSKAVMEAYPRIGLTECSTSKALNTYVLKQEWGSNAVCLTDGYGAGLRDGDAGPMAGMQLPATLVNTDMYEAPDIQLRAGAGALLFTGGYKGKYGFTERTTESTKGIEMLHDMCKRMLYCYCNSNAMTVSRDYTPYWKYLLGGVEVAVIAGLGVGWYKHLKRCHEEKVAATVATDGGATQGDSEEIRDNK